MIVYLLCIHGTKGPTVLQSAYLYWIMPQAATLILSLYYKWITQIVVATLLCMHDKYLRY